MSVRRRDLRLSLPWQLLAGLMTAGAAGFGVGELRELVPSTGLLFLFMPPVAAVAYALGVWAGLAAALTSAVAAAVLVLPPGGAIAESGALPLLGTYLAVTGASAVVAALARHIVRQRSGLLALEQERRRQQSALAELSQRALVGGALDDLLQAAAELLARALDVQYVEVLERLPDGQALRLRAGLGWRPELAGEVTVDAGPGTQAGFTLLAGDAVVVEDYAGESRFAPAPLLRAHGVRSGMSVPIPGPERPFGVLGVYTARLRRFTLDEVHVLRSAAYVLAAAVDREAANQALRRSEEWFRDLVENATDAVYTHDLTGTILSVNAAGARMLGAQPEELVGRDIFEVVAPEHRQRAREMLQQKLAVGGTTRYEVDALARDGRRVTLEVHTRLITGPEGVLAVAGIARDIGERKRAEEALRRQTELYEALLRALGEVGEGFLILEGERVVYANEACVRLSGYTVEELLALPSVLSLAAPDQRSVLEARLARALADQPTEDHYETAILRKDGRRVELEVGVRRLRAGSTVRFIVVVRDVTDRKQGEAAQRFLADASGLLAGSLNYRKTLARLADLVVPYLADWCSVYILEPGTERPQRLAVAHADPARRALAQQLLHTRTAPKAPVVEAIQRGEPVLLPHATAEAVVQATAGSEEVALFRALGTRSLLAVPLRARGRTFGVIAFVFGDSGRTYTPAELAVARQLAERAAVAVDNARLYREARRAARRERETRVAVEQARARLAFLAEASSLLATSLDYATTLRRLARLVVPQVADWCAVHALEEDGTVRRLDVAHRDPQREERVRSLLSRDPAITPPAASPLARVIASGRTVLVPEVTEEWLRTVAPNEAALQLARDLDLRAVLAVPLIARGRVLGAITLAMAESGRSFADEDVALAEELARRAGIAVDNARLFERERFIARTLQQAFLPAELPQVPGLWLHAAYLPGGTAAEVGGDWYDAFWLPNGALALSIGDVTGQGVEAAVTMGQIRQAIRAAAWDEERPSAVLTRAARLLYLSSPESMATVLFGVLDPVTRTLTYASAGHPGPVLASASGVRLLPASGLPLGIRLGGRFRDHQVVLEPGDLLVVYTDGLIELDRNPVDGEQALLRAAAAARDDPAADRARRIVTQVLGDRRPPDDIALVALTVAQVPLSHFTLTLPAIPGAVPLVRQALKQLAEAIRLPPERSGALQIAVGEAVNNVVEHAYGITPGPLRVQATVEAGALHVVVEDEGRWRPARADGGGRGLAIMRALVDRAEVAPSAQGTRVHLVLALAGVPTPAP